ncbi:MAG: DNA gyrase inhibitor YacG [Xanthobacteraceae bacterium]
MSNLLAPGSTRRGVCPICAKPAVEQFKPFCSRRCADIDLNRWLSGVYAVPAIEAEGDAEAEPAEDASPRRRE